MWSCTIWLGWLYRNTSENLLLAYTNRAVDEICSAIEALGPACADNYVRIGSRYSTAEPYRERLLSTGTASCISREEVRNLIGDIASLWVPSHPCMVKPIAPDETI